MATGTTYAELRQEIGWWFGYGRDSSAWTVSQQAEIAAALRDGLRLFLQPPILPGHIKAHRWSFLKPLTTITTVANTADQDLTTGLGVIGPLTFSGDSADEANGPIEIVSQAMIRQMRNDGPDTPGPPMYLAIVPKLGNQQSPQAWTLMWYPTPDAAYTISYQYNLNSVALDATADDPVGGNEHGRTLLAACLAQAEFAREDKRGSRWEDFLVQLQTSVSIDLQLNQKQTLGRMQNPAAPLRRRKFDGIYDPTEYGVEE